MRFILLMAVICGCATTTDAGVTGEPIDSGVDIKNDTTPDVVGILSGLDSPPKPCVAGDSNAALVCNDKNPCTKDECNVSYGVCQHLMLLDGTPCDDGNACTVIDQCASGLCAGKAKTCDDKNACTTDKCDAVSGQCVFVDNTANCDDGNACTTGDTCVNGACKGSELLCTDGNVCTDDSCDKIIGCVFQKIAQGKCDDGNACTTEKCVNGACVAEPVICDDGNPCTVDVCTPQKGCISTNGTNGDPCDDKNPCTVADACLDGACTSGQIKNCNDNNACTTDSCDAVSGQCVHELAIGILACDDNDKCTQDDKCAMVDGKPICAGKPLDCNDGNVCTSDTCDPKVGCVHLTNNGACNDGNACTTDDKCMGGVCAGTPVNCEDGNACTLDTCTSIGCVHTSADGISCNDGNLCTTAKLCLESMCVGQAINCDDNNPCTSEWCNPKIGCVYANVTNGAACDDGNACTSKESCQDGKCKGGAVVDCDDKNSCTKDSCDPTTGKCAWSPLPDDTVCNDGNGCTVGDSCNKGVCIGSLQKLCDDNDTCTKDSCDPTTGKCVNTQIPGCKP